MIKYFLILTLLGLVSAQEFCDLTPRMGYSGFNLGSNLIVITHDSTDEFWNYDHSTATLVKSTVNFWKNYFYGLYFGLTFDFDVCSNSTKYCDSVNKTKDLVIIYGTYNTTSDQYISFRSQSDGSFHEITNSSEMPFNWTDNGSNLTNSNIFPVNNDKNKRYDYFSGVFDTTRRSLIIITELFDLQSNSWLYGFHYRDLLASGDWGVWVEDISYANREIKALFMLNQILYAIEKPFTHLLEFKPDLSVRQTVSIKEFFNCRIETQSTTSSSTSSLTSDSTTNSIVSESSTDTTTPSTSASKNSSFSWPLFLILIVVIVIVVAIGISVAVYLGLSKNPKITKRYNSALSDTTSNPIDRKVEKTDYSLS